MKNKILILILLVICATVIPLRRQEKYVLFKENGQKIEFNSKKELILARKTSHQNNLSQIDKIHSHLHSGNKFYRENNFKAAADEYMQAYQLGEKALSGVLLAQVYEKMARYDEAIALLNSMIDKKQLSELGTQDAKAMISRLLAAKAQSAQSQSKP